jgi:hypothetical protein
MIKKYISEIHQKSEHHRRKVTYAASGLVTLMIALVWVTSFGYLHGLNETGDTIAEQSTTPGERVAVTNDSPRGPFSVLGANISNGYNAIRSSFGLKATNDNQDGKNRKPTLQYVPE